MSLMYLEHVKSLALVFSLAQKILASSLLDVACRLTLA